MSTLIDLTITINSGMPVHPYDDDIIFTQEKEFAMDEYSDFILTTGMHVGTHIDGPMHLTSSDKYLDEIPLDRFTGNAIILDAEGQDIIDYKKEYDSLVCEGDIVLIHTGHSNLYGKKEYYEKHPVLHKSIAEFFIKKNVKMVGFDLPSPDAYPFYIHKTLLSNDILIIENLVNLNKLKNAEKIHITAFPLKTHSDSAPARVIAQIQ